MDKQKLAVIKTGGKQYLVTPGDIIDVELLDGAEAGKQIEFKEVLYFRNGDDVKVGSPSLHKAIVRAEVLANVRAPKVIAYKYKRTKRSTRKKVGHRQDYNRVKITEVIA